MQKKGVPAMGTPAGEQGIATLKRPNGTIPPSRDRGNRKAFIRGMGCAMGAPWAWARLNLLRQVNFILHKLNILSKVVKARSVALSRVFGSFCLSGER
ncbi:MAG TPA: hypothetical protein VF534_34775 [Paraburkholderia sp.]